MMLISIMLGNRYYPIPYKWGRVMSFVAVGLAIYGLTIFIPPLPLILKYTIHTILIVMYILYYLKLEKISVWKLKL
ncbi:MAG TPA: hypothetical protein P5293_05795, partial [Bacteroidales bacterium]|nr:hypothetical protein [Bacteroidales bacterium]